MDRISTPTAESAPKDVLTIIPQTNTSTAMATAGAPSSRYVFGGQSVAVWTGTIKIVWGGANQVITNQYGTITPRGDGALIDPVTNSWSAMSTVDAPAAAFGLSLAWTGTTSTRTVPATR